MTVATPRRSSVANACRPRTRAAEIARTRAAIIMRAGRLLLWDEDGVARSMNERGEWVPWAGP